MAKTLMLIVNPRAGRSRSLAPLLNAISLFSEADYLVSLRQTTAQGDATRFVRENGAAFDRIVCYGGDGTLNETVTGLMDLPVPPPLGYIPGGSTNDFAHSLRIPSRAGEAAKIVVQDHPFACDIGSFNGDYFVYVAAFGAFTEVSYKTTQDMKNLMGHLAYVLNGVNSLFSIKPYAMKIEADDRVLEGDFIYGMVTNSESVGGFRNITGKDVQLDDGVFEVMLIRNPSTPLEWEPVLSGLLSQKADNKYIYYFKTSRIKITAKEEIAWTLDGEDGGKHQDVEILNLRQAVQIMVRKQKK